MDTGIQTATVDIEGRKIHYRIAGKGETILFIHGWPTSSYLWRGLMPGLARHYRVVAIDLPGFGKSTKNPEDSFSFRYYNRILDGFLAHLEIDQLTLGVHDLGGPIGLYWLIKHQERVKRLILFNTLVYPKFSGMVKLFVMASMLPGIRNLLASPGGLRRAMLFGVHQKEKLNHEIIKNYQEPFQEKAARKALLRTAHRLSMKGFAEIETHLKEYQGPVQILYGEKDKILPKVAATMQEVKNDLPQAQITSFPNSGHFLQEEIPEQLSEAVLAFMKA